MKVKVLFRGLGKIYLSCYNLNRLWHRCFPVNFAKFLRTPFQQNTTGDGFCDYEQLIMDCVDCIFIFTDGLAYLIPNGNISTEWAKVLSSVWEKLLFYREVKTPMLKKYFNPCKKYFLVW